MDAAPTRLAEDPALLVIPDKEHEAEVMAVLNRVLIPPVEDVAALKAVMHLITVKTFPMMLHFAGEHNLLQLKRMLVSAFDLFPLEICLIHPLSFSAFPRYFMANRIVQFRPAFPTEYSRYLAINYYDRLYPPTPNVLTSSSSVGSISSIPTVDGPGGAAPAFSVKEEKKKPLPLPGLRGAPALVRALDELGCGIRNSKTIPMELKKKAEVLRVRRWLTGFVNALPESQWSVKPNKEGKEDGCLAATFRFGIRLPVTVDLGDAWAPERDVRLGVVGESRTVCVGVAWLKLVAKEVPVNGDGGGETGAPRMIGVFLVREPRPDGVKLLEMEPSDADVQSYRVATGKDPVCLTVVWLLSSLGRTYEKSMSMIGKDGEVVKGQEEVTRCMLKEGEGCLLAMFPVAAASSLCVSGLKDEAELERILDDLMLGWDYETAFVTVEKADTRLRAVQAKDLAPCLCFSISITLTPLYVVKKYDSNIVKMSDPFPAITPPKSVVDVLRPVFGPRATSGAAAPTGSKNVTDKMELDDPPLTSLGTTRRREDDAKGEAAASMPAVKKPRIETAPAVPASPLTAAWQATSLKKRILDDAEGVRVPVEAPAKKKRAGDEAVAPRAEGPVDGGSIGLSTQQ
ncbi:hypothetical protein HK101_008851 [Irineochytrium annulatum]|nr:hypothetical protein HK101_008851 [Irineochytrium annulatum]